MCEAYRRQYGLRYVHLLPCNMMGRGDNYHPFTSHVIPAAIRKIDLALKSRQVPTFWGTGAATREFLNVRDAAKVFALAVESDYVGGPVNVGTGTPLAIRQVVEKVAALMGYTGPILSGTPAARRPAPPDAGHLPGRGPLRVAGRDVVRGRLKEPWWTTVPDSASEALIVVTPAPPADLRRALFQIQDSTPRRPYKVAVLVTTRTPIAL
jgi:nucleoside-diphosphate-sugar epimerase